MCNLGQADFFDKILQVSSCTNLSIKEAFDMRKFSSKVCLNVMALNSSRQKRRRLRRVDPRLLQKEDSDAVWNELAFFRNENRNLSVEK